MGGAPLYSAQKRSYTGVVTCCAILVQHTQIERGISVFEFIDEFSKFGVRHNHTSVQLNRWVTPRLLNKYGVLCQFVGFNAEA